MLKISNNEFPSLILLAYLFVKIFIGEYGVIKIDNIALLTVFISAVIICFSRVNYLTITYLLLFIIFYFIIQFFMRSGVWGFFEIVPPFYFAYYLIRGKVKPEYVALFSYVLILYYLYLGFFLKISPEDFGSSSRNMISFIVITLGALYLLAHHFRGSLVNSSFILLFLFFLISIYAYGRSGMVFSLLMVLASFVVTNKIKIFNGKNPKFYYIIFVIPSLYFFIRYGFDFDFEILYSALNYRFGNPAEDIRWVLISDFFENYSFLNLFVGFDFGLVRSISDLNDNPHNSYIQLIANYGLLGWLILFILVFKFVRLFLCKRISIILLVLPFFGRIFFDIGGFHGFALIIPAVFLLHGMKKGSV
jgi:hypothetical protein